MPRPTTTKAVPARFEIETAAAPLRALVIFPPARNAVKAMYTFHNDDPDATLGHKPPLGPLHVVSHARARSPHEVRLLDCQALNLDEESIRAEIEQFRPHVVGISAWTDFWYDASRCVQIAKSVDRSIHVTIGGPHVGIFPALTLERSGCDSIIQGDGEAPFLWLLNSLSHGRIQEDLPGLHLASSPSKPPGDAFYIQEDLDALAWPDRTLLDEKRYGGVLDSTRRTTTMITSRGCPYRCTFCKLSFQRTISRSAEHVLGEFEEIARLGFREVEIYDDTFTWSRPRLKTICDGLVERRLGIRWSIRDRVGGVTDESMSWLRAAGCHRIHFGIESGSNETLKRIKKGITVEEAEHAVRIAKKHGMEVLTYFMIGLPGETEHEMNESIRCALALDPDFSTFSVAVPYPGTEMYAEGLARGIIPRDFWREFAGNPTPHFVIPHFYEEHLSKSDLRRIRDAATRRFYFRPRYIWRRLRSLGSLTELRRQARMALGLFRISVLGRGARHYRERPTIRTGR